MSITLVSNAALSGKVASSGIANSADAGPVDFAALLSLQSLAFPPEIPSSNNWPPGLAAKLPELAEQDKPSSTDLATTVTDTAGLAAMLGLPPPPPPNATPLRQEGFVPTSRDDTSPVGVRDQQIQFATDKPTAQQTAKGEFSINGNRTPSGPVALSSDAANIAGDNVPNPAAALNLGATMSEIAPRRHPVDMVQTSIAPAVYSKAWPEQFGERLVWMARNDQQSAQININPPQLGPLQITLHLNGDQANALFVSPHAEVRQAIDAAMPQLREMLQSAGITLGDASVGANLAQQNANNPFAEANRKQSGHEDAILPANIDPAIAGSGQTTLRGNGLVDLFA